MLDNEESSVVKIYKSKLTRECPAVSLKEGVTASARKEVPLTEASLRIVPALAKAKEF